MSQSYYERNKERVLMQQKKYKAAHAEELHAYHAAYYVAHSADIKNQRIRRYFESEKERLQQKVACPCGVVVSVGCLKRHKSRRPHQLWLMNEASPAQYAAENGDEMAFFSEVVKQL